MIPAEDYGSPFGQYGHPGLGPPSMTEYTTPDGTKVSARALHGTVGLYVDLAGERYEASKACELFIKQLRALMQAAISLNPTG
jgi:hypothetical protein